MLMAVVAVALGAKFEHLHITSRIHLTIITGEIFIRDTLCFDH